MKQCLGRLGLERLRARFLLFFPPRIALLTRIERWLSRIPFGGQYVVVGQRASSAAAPR